MKRNWRFLRNLKHKMLEKENFKLSLETSTAESKIRKTSNLTKASKQCVVSKDQCSPEVKSKELPLLEQSLESLKFFSWMKQHLLWMKTPRNKFKKHFKTWWKVEQLSSLLTEWVLLKDVIRSLSLNKEKSKSLEISTNLEKNQMGSSHQRKMNEHEL